LKKLVVRTRYSKKAIHGKMVKKPWTYGRETMESYLGFKLSWLKNHNYQYVFSQLSLGFDKWRAKNEVVMPLPATSALKIDLGYALIRHTKWARTPIFAEIVVDFINSEHGLARSLSADLVETMLGQLATFQHTPPPVREDMDLLRYVFVSYSVLDEEENLATELGLGHNLGLRIKDISRQIRSLQNHETVYEFPSELDRNFRTIGIEVADQMKVTPWIGNILKLTYLINDQPESWAEDQNLAVKIFNLLLEIEKHKGLNAKGIEKFVAKHCDELKDQTLLISLLESKGLIFKESLRKDSKWLLSWDAQRLTSEAYGSQFMRSSNLDPKQFLGANRHYQAAVLRRIKAPHVPFLFEIVSEHISKVAPENIGLAVRQLARHYPGTEIVSLLMKLVNGHDMPWLHKALYAVLTELQGNRQNPKVEHGRPDDQVRETTNS
jgi:hypothetical protein